MRCEQGLCWAALPDWAWAVILGAVLVSCVVTVIVVLVEMWKRR